MLAALDLVGIGVFAASGALAAVRARLDVFGVVALGVATGLAGGVVRDLLLGVTPPITLRSWPYLLVPAGVALLTVRFHPTITRLRRAVLLTDAVGLGLLSTAGAATALATPVPIMPGCLVGMATGIAGGVVRDMLLREVPVVLRPDIYGLAALAGMAVVALGERLSLPVLPVTLVAAALATGLRVGALWRRWRTPASA